MKIFRVERTEALLCIHDHLVDCQILMLQEGWYPILPMCFTSILKSLLCCSHSKKTMKCQSRDSQVQLHSKYNRPAL